MPSRYADSSRQRCSPVAAGQFQRSAVRHHRKVSLRVQCGSCFRLDLYIMVFPEIIFRAILIAVIDRTSSSRQCFRKVQCRADHVFPVRNAPAASRRIELDVPGIQGKSGARQPRSDLRLAGQVPFSRHIGTVNQFLCQGIQHFCLLVLIRHIDAGVIRQQRNQSARFGIPDCHIARGILRRFRTVAGMRIDDIHTAAERGNFQGGLIPLINPACSFFRCTTGQSGYIRNSVVFPVMVLTGIRHIGNLHAIRHRATVVVPNSSVFQPYIDFAGTAFPRVVNDSFPH